MKALHEATHQYAEIGNLRNLRRASTQDRCAQSW